MNKRKRSKQKQKNNPLSQSFSIKTKTLISLCSVAEVAAHDSLALVVDSQVQVRKCRMSNADSPFLTDWSNKKKNSHFFNLAPRQVKLVSINKNHFILVCLWRNGNTKLE